mmetsp:Transcript_1283/g.3121  ORF Transcript_1283/g.3121 Transcript_1283/m.3121 type:complete len:235 (+) Transcript_1283:68-772(+)
MGSFQEVRLRGVGLLLRCPPDVSSQLRLGRECLAPHLGTEAPEEVSADGTRRPEVGLQDLTSELLRPYEPRLQFVVAAAIHATTLRGSLGLFGEVPLIPLPRFLNRRFSSEGRLAELLRGKPRDFPAGLDAPCWRLPGGESRTRKGGLNAELRLPAQLDDGSCDQLLHHRPAVLLAIPPEIKVAHSQARFEAGDGPAPGESDGIGESRHSSAAQAAQHSFLRTLEAAEVWSHSA